MSDEASPPACGFTDQAAGFWRGRGGHLTFVRRVICDCTARREAAFTADDLWTECRKIDHGISIASVYRTLVDLVQAGLVREIPRPNEQRLFVRADAAAADKGYLICKNCDRVIPLEDDCLALREGAAIRGLGFQTGGMRLLIEANCEALQKGGNCEHCKNPGESSHPADSSR